MISFKEYVTESKEKELLIKFTDVIEAMTNKKYSDETVMNVISHLAKMKNLQKKAVHSMLSKNGIKDSDVSGFAAAIMKA